MRRFRQRYIPNPRAQLATQQRAEPCASTRAVNFVRRAALVVLLSAGSSSLAGTVYQAEFEAAEGYTLGALDGQNGWINVTDPSSPGAQDVGATLFDGLGPAPLGSSYGAMTVAQDPQNPANTVLRQREGANRVAYISRFAPIPQPDQQTVQFSFRILLPEGQSSRPQRWTIEAGSSLDARIGVQISDGGGLRAQLDGSSELFDVGSVATRGQWHTVSVVGAEGRASLFVDDAPVGTADTGSLAGNWDFVRIWGDSVQSACFDKLELESGTVLVPLPPAVWLGVPLVGAMFGVSLWRRRHQGDLGIG